MKILVVLFFSILPLLTYSQNYKCDSIIEGCKKEFLYELHGKCGDKLIKFKEIGKTDSSKISLTEDIVGEDLEKAHYGNLVFQIKRNCESQTYSFNICFFILDKNHDFKFMESHGKILSLAPLHYRLLKKSNLIICLYMSNLPELVQDDISFIDEAFLDKMRELFIKR